MRGLVAHRSQCIAASWNSVPQKSGMFSLTSSALCTYRPLEAGMRMLGSDTVLEADNTWTTDS